MVAADDECSLCDDDDGLCCCCGCECSATSDRYTSVTASSRMVARVEGGDATVSARGGGGGGGGPSGVEVRVRGDAVSARRSPQQASQLHPRHFLQRPRQPCGASWRGSPGLPSSVGAGAARACGQWRRRAAPLPYPRLPRSYPCARRRCPRRRCPRRPRAAPAYCRRVTM